MATKNSTAEAIQSTLISPNVADSNGEPANVVDVINRVARALESIAEAIENLAAVLGERK